MHIERHVFGSVHGYGTLARSPGLTEAECRRLGGVSFGTPYDASYQDSLAREIAYLSLPLGPVKRAVTRVLPGAPDDAGRSTLLFVTAVISTEDWDFGPQGDVLPLLRQEELWRWDGSPKLAALEIPDLEPGPLKFSRESAGKILGLLSLVELSWAARRPVVTRADQYSLQEAAVVERLLPPSIRRRYSAVYRGLNADMPATLICLADGAPAGVGGGPRFLNEPKTPYALRLAAEGFGDGRMPDSLLLGFDKFGEPDIDVKDLPVEGPTVKTYVGRGSAGAIRRGAAPVSTTMLAAAMLLIFLIGGAAGWLAGSQGAPPPTNAATPRYDLLSDAVAMTTQTRERQLETIENIRGRLEETEDKNTEQYAELFKTLEDTRKLVQLFKKTEEQIAKTSRDDDSSIRRAKYDLGKLEETTAACGLLRDWFEARQRPAVDTLAVALEKMRAKIEPAVNNAQALKRTIDVEKAREARELRHALTLLESVTMDREPRWISNHLSQLDRLLDDYDSQLEIMGRQTQDSRQKQDDAQQASLGILGGRLDDLALTLQSTAEKPSTRASVAEALKRVSDEGSELMGSGFSDKMRRLADWILALHCAATPEHIEAVRAAAEDCMKLTQSLSNSVREIDRINTQKKNIEIARAVEDQARTLLDELNKLDDLARQLTTADEAADAPDPTDPD